MEDGEEREDKTWVAFEDMNYYYGLKMLYSKEDVFWCVACSAGIGFSERPNERLQPYSGTCFYSD